MKKRWAVLVLTAVMGGVLAACGSAQNAASEAESAASAKSGGTEENTAADAAGKVTVEFFNQKVEIVDILEELIAEYETENPGIHIELTTPAQPATVLASRMASDDTPDVFGHNPSTTMFTQVDSGYIMNLADTGIMDNIQEAARKQWEYNGGEYAAPISYNVSGIWYNTAIFEEAGITELPQTWEELLALCDQLQAAEITPFVTSAKTTDITDRQLQVFLASSMGGEYQAFEDDAAAASLDPTKPYAAALNAMAQKMVTLVGYSQPDVMGTDQDSATANFANGQGAMMIGGSWLRASITAANPDIQIAMMPIPGDTAQETNTCAYPGDFTLCIAEKTDVKDEAIAFVKWMTSPETATKYAEAEGNPSCIIGVDYVAPEFDELYADYVTSGKFILNPDCYWSMAQQDAVGAMIQQLYYDGDSSVFAENLATAFNE